MIDSLSYYFALYSKAVAVNPLLAGFALYFTSVLTYLARNVPKALWDCIKHSTTTSMEMNNAGYSNEYHYTQFLMWFMHSPWSKWSRSLYTGRGQVRSYGGDDTIIGPGIGHHFFFLKGRLFWFHKEQTASSGADRQKEQITITTFGRRQRPLLALVSLFEFKQTEDTIAVYNFCNKQWDRVTSIHKRSLDTVCIPKETKASLLKRIDRFVHHPTWFREKGLAYKMTTLLQGSPGTGKSTIVKAIAGHYNRNIYRLDLGEVSNQTLQHALATLPPKSVLLMEDVDAATKAANSRTDPQASSNTTSFTDLVESRLTLAGLLNALDGIIPMNDVIVFMTTNYPEKLDAALTRKSRVDYRYEIGPMTNPEIHEYVKLMYPDALVDSSIVFATTIGCDVQAAFLETPDDVAGFLDQISHSVVKQNYVRLAEIHR